MPALTAALELGGCHAAVVLNEKKAPAAGSRSELDAGVQMLASVDNAVFAIGLKDDVAASNDVGQALGYADTLADQPSALIPDDPTSTIDRGAAPGETSRQLTASGARAQLVTAQAALMNADMARAAKSLKSMQADAAVQTLPTAIPLFQAAQSLTLARTAVATGRPPDLDAQLLTARSALQAYSGRQHRGEARRIGGQIAVLLRTRADLPAGQLDAWWGAVQQWR